MKKKSFLYPTKGKVLSTLIVLGFVFAATFLMDVLGDLLVPADLMEFLSQGEFMESLMERQSEIITLGVKVLALGALLNLVAVYLAVCIIFHYFKNE